MQTMRKEYLDEFEWNISSFEKQRETGRLIDFKLNH